MKLLYKCQKIPEINFWLKAKTRLNGLKYHFRYQRMCIFFDRCTGGFYSRGYGYRAGASWSVFL